MIDHDDARAAADYATLLHRRDAKAKYEEWGFSEATVAELLNKEFFIPAALVDREHAKALTEDYMQRELSAQAFGEIKAFRRK
ncbi:hypothetical protein [Agrobacterium cavarae]|uniref:hypothetical protein n=1 Tax=Agrobacterium cavarae TaxID=2528239 RepID=UPI003FD5CB14